MHPPDDMTHYQLHHEIDRLTRDLKNSQADHATTKEALRLACEARDAAVEGHDVQRRLKKVQQERAEKAEAERDAAIRERDEARAHDQQPYPTADAYEKACAALEKVKTERDAALAQLAEIDRDRAEHGHHAGCRVNERRLRAEVERLRGSAPVGHGSDPLVVLRAYADDMEASGHPNRAEHLRWACGEVERLANKLNTDSQTFEIECHKETIRHLRADVERLRGIEEAAQRVCNAYNRCDQYGYTVTASEIAVLVSLLSGTKPGRREG